MSEVCYSTFTIPKGGNCTQQRSVKRHNDTNLPIWDSGTNAPDWDDRTRLKDYAPKGDPGDFITCFKETSGPCSPGDPESFDTLCDPESIEEKGWCARNKEIQYKDKKHPSFYPSYVSSSTMFKNNNMYLPLAADKNTCKNKIQDICKKGSTIADSARASARSMCYALQEKKDKAKGGFPNPVADIIVAARAGNNNVNRAIRDVMTEQQLQNYMQNRSACENTATIVNINDFDNECETEYKLARGQRDLQIILSMETDEGKEEMKKLLNEAAAKEDEGSIFVTQENSVDVKNNCYLNALLKSSANIRGDLESSVAQSATQEAVGLLSKNESSQQSCEVISTRKTGCSYLENVQCCYNTSDITNKNIVTCPGSDATIKQENTVDLVSICQISADTNLSQKMIETLRTSVEQSADQLAESGLDLAGIISSIMDSWTTIIIAMICLAAFSLMFVGHLKLHDFT